MERMIAALGIERLSGLFPIVDCMQQQHHASSTKKKDKYFSVMISKDLKRLLNRLNAYRTSGAGPTNVYHQVGAIQHYCTNY
jgi:hypothetical protein